MDYILSGKAEHVRKILQENRIRVRRGDVRFIPVSPANVGVLVADTKYVSSHKEIDSKTPHVIDEKKPRKRRKE